MLSFVPIDNASEMEVNHKNEIKDDNRLENLEWCTSEYNIHYGTALERSVAAHCERVICIETGIIYKSLTEAAELNSIHLSNLSACCNGKINTCKGMHWKFLDR